MLILEEKFRRHLEAFASELWDTIYIYIVYQIINISLVSKLKKMSSQWRFYCQGVHRGLINIYNNQLNLIGVSHIVPQKH